MATAKTKVKRYPYRRLETMSRDYVVERVVTKNADVGNIEHYQLTVTSAISNDVIEQGTIFNSAREADTGLLDRACTR